MIRVDIDPAQRDKNVAAPTWRVIGDARAVLAALADAERAAPRRPDARCATAIREEALRGRRAVAAADGRARRGARRRRHPGRRQHAGRVLRRRALPARWTPRRRFVYPTGYATLGYALPAAIGAKLAAPERPVIALIGDGGLLFTVAELATAAELGLPLPVVVPNNGGYGEIRDQMVDAGIDPVGVDLARARPAEARRGVRRRGRARAAAGAIGAMLLEALERPGPTVIEVPG